MIVMFRIINIWFIFLFVIFKILLRMIDCMFIEVGWMEIINKFKVKKVVKIKLIIVFFLSLVIDFIVRIVSVVKNLEKKVFIV